MTNDQLAAGNVLAQRIGRLRGVIQAGADAFLAKESPADTEVKMRPGAREALRETIMADLQAQLAAAEAEFRAL